MTSASTDENLHIGSRVPSIDVLRGIAALLVVLNHITVRFRINGYQVSTPFSPAVEQVLFWSGYYAVIIFFVISGFLITSLSLRRWGALGSIPLPTFYRLRAARIFPCLLLLLAILSALYLAGCADYLIKPERSTLTRALIAALTFHINWLEGMHGYLPGNWDVLWSLSVEEVFYMLFPLLCITLRHDRWIALCLLAVIVIGPFNRVALQGRDPWSDYAYLSCMDGIAFGCIAAWIATRVHVTHFVLRLSLAGGVAAVVFVGIFRDWAHNLGLGDAGLNATLLELGVALMLIALSNNVGNRALSKGTASLQRVGRSSYEIYLTHMFIVFAVMRVFKRVCGESPSGAAYAITYLCILVLSIILGLLVSRWYSEPLNRKFRGA